jgi:hypothetical protein
LLLFAAVCFPQSHYRHSRAQLERAEEAAQVPDEELLQRPVFEVLVDRAGLNQKTEANSQLTSARFYERHQQALRDRKRCLYSTLVVAQANAARAACVAAAAEREAAAAAAAAEAVAENEEEPEELQQQEQPPEQGADGMDTDVGDQAPASAQEVAAAAAAAAEAAAAAASAAAADVPQTSVQQVAYGRVGVLYASWTKWPQVGHYNWNLRTIATSEQQQAAGVWPK